MPDDNAPISLAAARVDQAESAVEVSVADILEHALIDAQDGRWDKALLILARPDGAGNFHIDMRAAGVSLLESRGLLLSWMREDFLIDDE